MKKIESLTELFGVVSTTAKNHGANVQSWQPSDARVNVELRGAFVGVLSVLQRVEVAGEATRVTAFDVRVARASGEITAHCTIRMLGPGEDLPETTTARRFESLARSIPTDAWLEAYRDQGGQIEIEGRATTLDQVTKLIDGLEKSKQLTDVSIVRTARSGDFVTFQLKAKAS